MACSVPGLPSLGCGFATLSAAQRCERSLVQPQEQVTTQVAIVYPIT
jgi:hypothetical protein